MCQQQTVQASHACGRLTYQSTTEQLNFAIGGSQMESLSLPTRYGIMGLIAGLAGFALSLALGLNPEAPWWAFMIAGGVGGYIAGLLKQKRSS